MSSSAWFLRLVAASILVVGVTGCVTTTPTVETFRSAPRETVLAAGEGGLIIGLKAENFLTATLQDVRRLELWQVDQARNLLVDPERGGKVVGLTRGSWMFGRDKSGDTEYILQKLPAGTYFLAYVDWGDHGRSPIREKSIAFTVKPGAVTYVGNYGFDTPWTIFGQVGMTSLPRDVAAARGLLSQYPQLAGAMWNQEPTVMALACSLEVRPPKSCLVPA
jgi:hypothetical protein